MRNQKLGILAIVAAIMVVFAVVQSRKPRTQAGPSGPTYLIQGLDPEQISGIMVGTGKNAVRIQKQNDRFVVVNKSNYPADTKQINDLIAKCLDIKTAGLRTDKQSNHADLEVTEEKARHVVKFLKDANSVLTGVVVGKSLENGQGAFVRRVDSNDVYVTDSAPGFGSTAMDFIGAEILAVKREDVNNVKVTTPEGSYTLKARKGSDSVTMESIPADKNLKDSEAKGVLQSLSSLRFDDVNEASAVGDLKFDGQYVCQLNNTTEYTLKLAKKNGKTYLRCEATYGDMSPVVINTGQKDSDQERKTKEAKLLAQEHVQKFTLLHKDWVYVIPDWKANYLTKKQADLLADTPKPAAADPNTSKPTDPNATPPKPIAAAAPAQANAPQPADPNAAAKPASPVANPNAQSKPQQ
jgi:hypothetical protein